MSQNQDELEDALNKPMSENSNFAYKGEDEIKSSYKNDGFSTRDITLVATLKAIGYNILFVEFQLENGRDVGYFTFEDSEALQKDVNRFYNGEILVEPKKFMLELKAAKSRVTSYYKKTNTIE